MNTRTSITCTEIDQMRDNGKQILLVDVRSKAEYEENHIPEAVNIPIEEIEAENFSNDRDKDAVIITACGKGGGRSERAATYLREQEGYESYFLEGGTFGWAAKTQ